MCIKKCDPDHRKCKFPTGFHRVSKCMHVIWYMYVHGLATIIDELLMSFGNYLFLDLFGVYIVTIVHYYINSSTFTDPRPHVPPLSLRGRANLFFTLDLPCLCMVVIRRVPTLWLVRVHNLCRNISIMIMVPCANLPRNSIKWRSGKYVLKCSKKTFIFGVIHTSEVKIVT